MKKLTNITLFPVKKLVNIALNIVLILIISSLPEALLDDGKHIFFSKGIVWSDMKHYYEGLFNGKSFTYQLGDKTIPYFSDVLKYATTSYEYLALAGGVAILISVTLAVLISYYRQRWVNELIGFVSIIPDFILVLALQMGVVLITQSTGIRIANVASASSDQPAILLPLICLTLLPTFYLLRTLLQGITEVSSEEYVLTAKAKGLMRIHIYLLHILPNLLPFLKADLKKVTIIMIGNLFIIEYLFNIKGMTEMAFLTPFQFGYQYDVVINSFIVLWVIYFCVLYTFYVIHFCLKRLVSTTYTQEEISNGSTRFKKIVNIVISLGLIFFIAALPKAFFILDGELLFLNGYIIEEIKDYFKGLFTGDSFFYSLGDKTVPYFHDAWKYASTSYEYLALAGVIAILVSVTLAVIIVYFRLSWVNEIIGFVSIIPDFVLVLLLQIGVVFITQKTGVRIASVASASRDQPAILLPLITLTLLPTFYLLRNLLLRITEVSSEEYILVAKAKGLRKLHIYLFHIVPNLLPFLKGDLHKITTIMIGNLFIIEYLFNISGITELVFLTPFQFGFQYDIVINSFFVLWALYFALYYTFRLLQLLIKGVLNYGY